MSLNGVESVIETAKQAVEPKIINAPAEPKDVYYTYVPGGKLERVYAETGPRNHIAKSLSTIREFIKEHAEDARVFYSREEVVVFTDDHTRRDRITFRPELTEPFKFLLDQNGKGREARKFSQADFVFFLRTTIGEVGRRVRDAVKKVTLKQLRGGVSEIGHGKSSLAKEDLSELMQHEVPEEVYWEIPVFRDPAPNVLTGLKIALEIYIEGDSPKFQLIPVAGEIERALMVAETVLVNDIVEGIAGVEIDRIHHGKP